MGKKKKDAEVLRINNIKIIDTYTLYVLLLGVGILPLLVRGKILDFVAPNLVNPTLFSGLKGDIFTYYKFIFLVIITLVALALFLYKIVGYRYEIRKNYSNIPLVILMVSALVATMMSHYSSIALMGMYNRHEGLVTYLCYFLLFFIAVNIKFEHRYYKWILYAIGLVVIINSILQTVYFYGIDLTEFGFVSSLISPSSGQKLSGSLMGTINNPNYISGFLGATCALFIPACILSQRITNKIIWGILAIVSFIGMLAALSTSGFLVVVVLFPLGILLSIKVNGLKSLIPGVALAIVLVLSFNVLNAHNPEVYNQTIGPFKTSFAKISDRVINSGYAWAAPIPSEINQPDKSTLKPDHFELPANKISFGSGRGYIWSETLKLIKARPLFGYGFDTYVFEFPQNDRNMEIYNVLVDKPHNIYLGMGFSAGLIFLLAFLVMVALHLINTWRGLSSSVKNIDTYTISSCLLCFWLGFLIQGLVNDSVIGTSPIFWILFGLAIGLNLELKEAEVNSRNA